MDLDARVGDSTARSLITKFTGDRANLPDMPEGEAGAFLRERARTQPKLMAVLDQDPCVRRAYGIMEQGRFHGTVRHEGGITDLDHERRILLREDPAQPDPAKRAQGLDGCRTGKHFCGEKSCSISDPVAYAVALVRGIEHPAVRDTLERPYHGIRPEPVSIPITELLGPNGHEHCKGYQLDGSSRKEAVKARDAWLTARWNGDPADVPSPRVSPIPTFEGGMIQFRFTANKGRDGYELTSMFPAPLEKSEYLDKR